MRSLCVFTILAVPAAGLAQQAAPTVDQIVAQHVAARGGAKALAAVRTLRMSGHAIEGPGREAIIRREIARPNRIRTEFEFQGTTGVYVWDGKGGWQVSPLDGSLDVVTMPPDAAAVSAEQADFEGPLVDWKKKGHKVDLVGTSTLAGGPAHDLKVTMKSGQVRHVWIDAATGEMVKSSSTRTVKGHKTEFEVLFGDYKETSGVRFARTIDMGVTGRPRRMKIVVDNVEVNPALGDARFRRPR
jgi:outer membrane lipoprotein-sorting protein